MPFRVTERAQKHNLLHALTGVREGFQFQEPPVDLTVRIGLHDSSPQGKCDHGVLCLREGGTRWLI